MKLKDISMNISVDEEETPISFSIPNFLTWVGEYTISIFLRDWLKKFNELNRFDTKPSDMSKYKVVKINDIAYNSMRMWQGASGLSPYNGILSPAYTVITPKENVCSSFFTYLIKKPELIHQFEINLQGLTKDTWNLSFQHLAK